MITGLFQQAELHLFNLAETKHVTVHASENLLEPYLSDDHK